MRFSILVATFLLPAALAHGYVREFAEEGKKSNIGLDQNEYEKFKAKSVNEDKYHGGFRDLYKTFSETYSVPGFISATPLNEIARIVGPDVLGTSFRVGDTIYLRWGNGPSPQIGSIYSVYTPAAVTQNMEDPTDFSVGLAPATAADTLPRDHRLAGYFYEGTGRVRITKIGQGLVEAVLENQTGQIQMGDQLMPPLPQKEKLKPIHGTIQLAAAVVCGSPADRISTMRHSFIYINRGSRDGIKVGQIFEAVERVGIENSVSAANPEVSAGEAVVIYSTDAFSTAMITKQFDVIRMGSLLRTRSEFSPTPAKSPFTNMRKNVSGKSRIDPENELRELPAIDDDLNNAPNLPDPMKKRPEPKLSPLSELDALERSMQLQNLTPEEKARLSKLSRQERVGENGPKSGADEEEDNPDLAGLENSFSKGKKPAKKATKKQKTSNDEEELNNLMMQN